MNHLDTVGQKIQEAIEAYVQIPFSEDAKDVPLFVSLTKAALEVNKLKFDPQNGISLKEFCESIATKRETD